MKALFQIFQNFVGNPDILLAEITEVLDLTSNIRGTDTGKCEAIFLCTQIKDLTCGLVGEHEFLSFARCHTCIQRKNPFHPGNPQNHGSPVSESFISSLNCGHYGLHWFMVKILFRVTRVNQYASSSRSICPWARSRTFCANLPITSANRYSCWAIVKPVPLTWPYKVFLKYAHVWSVGCNVLNVTLFYL